MQWLRAPTGIPKVPSSVPSMHSDGSHLAVTLPLGICCPFLAPMGTNKHVADTITNIDLKKMK